ncbi:MAG TPA: T9SS type A sorting domain-containing protein [Chitinophagaceae bacterium]|nr:T9SS type A sorting domain-containing protein [Chitinophagaceae bacterium]
MEKKFTFFTRASVFITLTLILLAANSFTAVIYAQASCGNSKQLFAEDFGTGTTATTNPDIIPGSLVYQATGSLKSEGVYRIINNSGQKPEWHHAPDHTGNVNGKMLVANGEAETFYRHVITSTTGFFLSNTSFSASLFALNADTLHTCASPLFTTLTYNVEYLDVSAVWQPMSGSPYIAPALPQLATPTWVLQGALFTLPSTGTFHVTTIRLTVSDGTVGGCGNDFAIDDINISQCPEGNPTPVEFLNIIARQKGSGVSVDWSTSQEFNSDYFDIEKSTDGNNNWAFVSTVKGAGNSSLVRAYNAYDSRPYSGNNFYRIKQVDKDGKFKYSKTVNVKINTSKTGVSVLANPFHNVLTIDFLSSKAEVINARLIDITGKQVASEKWSVSTGNTRKDFSNVSGLQQGMYILTVSNTAGEILYNNKVIKQ